MSDLPADALLWPRRLLRPSSLMANLVPFSRGGGRSLGGQARVTRTDRGWWSISYKGVALGDPARRRAWNAIRTSLVGMAGLVAVPVWTFDATGTGDDTSGGEMLVTHSDGSRFSDGSRYSQPLIQIEMAATAAIGATSVTLRLVYGIDDLSGIRFSYNHALYETGNPTLVDGDEWTVPVFPAVRAEIPADASLEVDLPTCLCHLASDRAMDVSLDRGLHDRVDVSFEEAVDYWNDLAGA